MPVVSKLNLTKGFLVGFKICRIPSPLPCGAAMEVDIETVRQAVGKVLDLVTGGVLEAWAGSQKIGTYLWALRMELLNSQWVLNNTRSHGRKIQNPALAELLQELWDVVNRANNMLDELDYFRIQDELEGTYREDNNGCTDRFVSSVL